MEHGDALSLRNATAQSCQCLDDLHRFHTICRSDGCDLASDGRPLGFPSHSEASLVSISMTALRLIEVHVKLQKGTV